MENIPLLGEKVKKEEKGKKREEMRRKEKEKEKMGGKRLNKCKI